MTDDNDGMRTPPTPSTLSPTQIAQKRFHPALRGWDRHEVRAFLVEVAGVVGAVASAYTEQTEQDYDTSENGASGDGVMAFAPKRRGHHKT
jgi:DivIVA domain-containing protein